MTPIFKRYFKKEIRFIAFCLLFAVINFLTAASSAEKWVDKIKYITDVKNITAASFDTEEGRAAAEEMGQTLQTDRMYEEGFLGGFGTNSKDCLVPNLVSSLEKAVHQCESFAYILGMACAAAFAAYAFMAERKKNTAGFIGVLPYKRSYMFVQKWLSGFICLAAFFVAVYIMLSLWVLKITPEFDLIAQRLAFADYQLWDGAKTCGQEMLMAGFAVIAFYSFIMFMQTLFGQQKLAVIAAAAGMVLGFWALHSAADFYFAYDLKFSYGFFRKAIKAMGNAIDMVWPVYLTLAVITAVFFAAGLFCDKAAKLERAGEIFMFRPVKWFCYIYFMTVGAFAFWSFATDYGSFGVNSLGGGIALLIIGAAAMWFVLWKIIKE